MLRGSGRDLRFEFGSNLESSLCFLGAFLCALLRLASKAGGLLGLLLGLFSRFATRFQLGLELLNLLAKLGAGVARGLWRDKCPCFPVRVAREVSVKPDSKSTGELELAASLTVRAVEIMDCTVTGSPQVVEDSRNVVTQNTNVPEAVEEAQEVLALVLGQADVCRHDLSQVLAPIGEA